MNEEFEFETFEEQPSLLETEEAEFRMTPIVRDHRSVGRAAARWQPPVRTAWQRAPAPRPLSRPVYTTRPLYRPAYRSGPVVRAGYAPWSYTRPGYTAYPPYYSRQPMQWQPGYRNAPSYWQQQNQNPFAPGSGTRDEQIRWVQRFLNRILNQNLPVDGVMSPVTRRAVRNFQQRYGLPATGYVGLDTQQALVATTTQPLPESAGPGPSADSGAPPPSDPPQATTDAELFEFPQDEFSDNEFESFSDHENWQSELNSANSSECRHCNCHRAHADSAAYEFEWPG